MTKEEKLIVTAYTGVMMCDFSEFHKYAEKVLGRTLYSHELSDDSVVEELTKKVKPDFLKLCMEDEDDD